MDGWVDVWWIGTKAHENEKSITLNKSVVSPFPLAFERCVEYVQH
jgi:hypothetical protein